MEIPLIVTENSSYEMAREFYPQVELQYLPLAELTLDYLAHHFDLIYQCGKFWALELIPLFELLYQKKMRIVFCPHGNSDKGHSLDLSQVTLGHDIALVYGEQMVDQLKETGGEHSSRYFVKTGNLRLNFYQEHKVYLDHLADTKVFCHFDRAKPVILYAPTWNTEESPTSFFQCTSALIDSLTPRYQLLVKPHPLLEENHPAHYYRLLGLYENRKEVFFLNDFPAIYPLLEKIDIYIGDYSSIGYDFLHYDRPLYFLNPDKKQKTLLQQCGTMVENIEELSAVLEKNQKELSKIRKETYKYAFGSNSRPEQVKARIEKRLYLEK